MAKVDAMTSTIAQTCVIGILPCKANVCWLKRTQITVLNSKACWNIITLETNIVLTDVFNLHGYKLVAKQALVHFTLPLPDFSGHVMQD
jgi:hypothetical protein